MKQSSVHPVEEIATFKRRGRAFRQQSSPFYRPRTRRVTAQRKFAQGAFMPPQISAPPPPPVPPAPSERPAQPAQEAANVSYNGIQATNFLNIVAFPSLIDVVPEPETEPSAGTQNAAPTVNPSPQNAGSISSNNRSYTSAPQQYQPVVLIERLRNRKVNADENTKQIRNKKITKRNTKQIPTIRKTGMSTRNNPIPVTRYTPSIIGPRKPRVPIRNRPEVQSTRKARTRVLSTPQDDRVLVSTRLSNKQKKIATKSKGIVKQKLVKRSLKKKISATTKEQRFSSPDYSLEDNQPLTYFTKCPTSTPKTQNKNRECPEPVAGPSGIQKTVAQRGQETDVSQTGSNSSMRSLYYSSEHNIHQWMMDSQEAPDVTTDICPLKGWVSVKDIREEQAYRRCFKCNNCVTLNKVIRVSNLILKQVKLDGSGEPFLPSQHIVDRETEHLYLDLSPKNSTFALRLDINSDSAWVSLVLKEIVPTDRQDRTLGDLDLFLDQSIENLEIMMNETAKRASTSAMSVVEDRDFDPTNIADVENEICKSRARGHQLAEKYDEIVDDDERSTISIQPARRMAVESDGIDPPIFRRPEIPIPKKSKRTDAKVASNNRPVRPDSHMSDYAESDVESRIGGPAPSIRILETPLPMDKRPKRIVDAPVFHLTGDEFNNPIEFFEMLWPQVREFGICKIVPPVNWKPDCYTNSNMSFDTFNQYISRMYNRWGTAAREVSCFKMCLLSLKIKYGRTPLLNGVEVNLPKLYHTVQRLGGLEHVSNKNKWNKVAELMRVRVLPNTLKRLDQIYVKYLLPYVTLNNKDKHEHMLKIEQGWNYKNQKLLQRAVKPLFKQTRMVQDSDSSEDDYLEEDVSQALAQAEDCVVRGTLVTLSMFKRAAESMYQNHFGDMGPGEEPSLSVIEDLYWRRVLLGNEHLCVNTAYVHTGEEGYGFPKEKKDNRYTRHPWNLKNFHTNTRNVLRHLGPVLGVTVPTLHFNMLFSTSCWHKDPHGFGWTEYMHEGAPKIWYGVPDGDASRFRMAVEILSPSSCQNKAMWLPSDVTIIPPSTLLNHNVLLSRTVQGPNEFVVVCPGAYSCSISTGYSVSESTYFATREWLYELWDIYLAIRKSCEPTMFSLERLLLSMAENPETDNEDMVIVLPFFQKIISDEINYRQLLQEHGVTVRYEEELGQRRNGVPMKPNEAWNVRDYYECEYCRTTLFLSSMQGIPVGPLCLEHAVKLLELKKYKTLKKNELFLTINVTVKRLNAAMQAAKNRVGPLKPDMRLFAKTSAKTRELLDWSYFN